MTPYWSFVQMWEINETNPKWVGAFERLPDCRIALVRDGHACWTLDGEDHFVSAGDVVVVLPGTIRQARILAAPLRYVAMRCAWPERTSQEGNATVGFDSADLDPMRLPGRIYVGLEEVEALTTLLRRARVELEIGRAFAGAMVDTLLRQFFIRLCRIADAQRTSTSGAGAKTLPPTVDGRFADLPPQLVLVLEQIHLRLDTQISVTELAEMASYSVAHLRRLFCAYLGASPTQYVIRARLRRAKDLLRATTLSVTEIAAAVGYADALHFSRRFKAAVGISPSAYATRHRDPTT